jgi:hypothetical protein
MKILLQLTDRLLETRRREILGKERRSKRRRSLSKSLNIKEKLNLNTTSSRKEYPIIRKLWPRRINNQSNSLNPLNSLKIWK